MTTLRLFSGNCLDVLAGELARVLRTPLASPFDPELILVQSKGMERWLSMQIAEHLGVCANCRFPFPNAFVDDIFRKLFPDLPNESLFDPRFCTWRILETLPHIIDSPGFEALSNYLGEPGFTLKALQLSQRIAETFDQYVIYRPDFITAWESGQEHHWQAVLWRELSKGSSHKHRSALRDQLMERLQTAPVDSPNLPERVNVFGISYLPPFHLHILKALSQFTQVNLFLLNPCKEYWGDITARIPAGGRSWRSGHSGASPEDLHLEQGNSLLASMGTLGRDFFDLLISLDCEEITHFHDPGQTSLLHRIQSDILHLRGLNEASGSKTLVAEDDRSIQIHSCHSPMREVEVLHDVLLGMFDSTPGLLPMDILVMAPDIDAYAPLIQAVFDAPGDPKTRIPFSIADRNPRKGDRATDTFLSILECHDERLTASQVLSILESPPVLRRFGLVDSDMEIISRWVREVRIRWGIDEQHRLRWVPTPFRENTWEAGVDRLLLGYAMPDRGGELFQGIRPYGHMEGSEAAVLGNFLAFLDTFFSFMTSLEAERSLSQWFDTLSEALASFFPPDEDAQPELQRLRKVLADLRLAEEVSGFRGAVGIPLVKWLLERELTRQGNIHGFMTGGVTFCSTLPMRSIPFRVICLMGMSESSFPRQSRPTEFDLMPRNPKPGDRSLRNEDRYLFLEALVSARETLIITYTGQSSQDNSLIPPSVLVSELMDTINRDFTLQDRDRRDWVLTRHRLQPFNPAYFRGDSWFFSYSEDNLQASRNLAAGKTDPVPFVTSGLAPPDESFRNLSLDTLCRFFRNPAGYLLEERLGIKMGKDETLLDDTEPFTLEGLEKYGLEQELLESVMSGASAESLFPMVKASGLLPHGNPGQAAFKRSTRSVDSFATELRRVVTSDKARFLDVELDVTGFHLSGRIQPIHGTRFVRYRHAKLKARDHLDLWIPHLALNVLATPNTSRESTLIGLEDKKTRAVHYGPLSNAGEILVQLLDLYWQGLTKPLRFFPETSLAYARATLGSGKSPEEALMQARNVWEGSDFRRGESEDTHLDLCFKDMDPLDPEFQRVSELVFRPMLEARMEGPGDE